MAVLVDATLAGEFSNSYCDVTYCDEYWAEHFNTTKTTQWDALGEGQKQNLLVQATSILETARFTKVVNESNRWMYYDRTRNLVIDFNTIREPVRYYYYQNLQFPRNLDVNITGEGPDDVGDLYIPQAMKNAQCEQALYLLNFNEAALSNRLQGITLEKITLSKDDIGTTTQYAGAANNAGLTIFSPIALEFCRPYFVRSVTIKRG